jgi:hypothetical protein
LGTDLLGKPDSDKDDQDKPLFNNDSSINTHKYDDHLGKIAHKNEESKSDRSKKLTADTLAGAETAGGTGDTDLASAKEKANLGASQDDDSDWKTDVGGPGKKRRIKINGRVAAIGGAAGFGIGAIFGMSVLTSGPLQFIHLAQMMQNFHFFSHEESSDDRLSKIHKYLKYKNKPQDARLGKIEGKVAKKLDTRLEELGITSNFDRGKLKSYDIDAEKYAKAHGIDNTPEAIGEHVRNNLNVEVVHGEGGKFSIPTEDIGFFKNRKLAKGLMTNYLGEGRVTGAMTSRIMTKRTHATLHPLKYLDQQLKDKLDEAFKDFQKKRAKRNTKGAETEISATNSKENDDKGNPKEDPGGDANKKAVDDAVGESKPVGEELKSGDIKADGPTAKLKGKFKGAAKIAGGITAAVGFVCMVDAMSKQLDALKYANVVLPLIRIGMEFISVGNQVMSGHEVSWEALRLYNQLLNDPETKSSWAEAMSIQAEMGKPLTGKDILPEAAIQNEQNVVSQFISTIGAVVPLNTICGAINSTVGQVISFALDVASGPFSAAGGLAFSTFVAGPLGESLIGWLAGNPVNVEVKGVDLGNYINFGARLAAGSTGAVSGGKSLGKKSAMEWKEYRLAVEKEDMQNMSIANRLFNPYDYRTLAGRFVDGTNSDATQNIAKVVTSPMGAFSSLTRSFGTIFAPKAFAQESNTYDYGFDTYGFDIGELENPKIDNPFENATKAIELLKGAKGEEFKKRAKVCFGTTFDSNNNPNAAEGEGVPKLYEINATGAIDVSEGEKVTPNCKDSSDDWLRIRAYILDTQTGDSMACYEGDEGSCPQTGAGGSTSTKETQASDSGSVAIDGDTSNVPCGSGKILYSLGDVKQRNKKHCSGHSGVIR